MRYSAPLLLLPVLLLLSSRSSDAEKMRAPRAPHPPYSLIRDTSLPSHKYTIAWGVKGRSVDWNLLDNSTKSRAQSYLFDDSLSDEKKLQNYVVDRQSKRILGVIHPHYRAFHHYWDGPRKLLKFTAGGDYWRGAGSSKNHADVSTCWLRDESIGVLFYDGKWWYDAIYGAEKVGDKFCVTEVGDAAEEYLRRYLDGIRHRAYQAVYADDDRYPAIRASNFQLT